MTERSDRLTLQQREQVDGLVVELLRWNRKINLTGHREEQGMRRDLIEDGLALAEHVRGGTVLDIGSGAGFPGLVLAIALPAVQVTMLEPREKRVAFIHHMIRTLNLGDRAEAVRGRASVDRKEDPGSMVGRYFDTVTMRAVTDLEGSLELARPYVSTQGGRVLLPRGEKDAADAEGMGLTVKKYCLDGVGERLGMVLDT